MAACDVVYNRFSCIMQLLNRIINESNDDRACDAEALRALIDFRFVFCLVIFHSLLKSMKSASDYLQSKSICMDSAFDLVESRVATVQEMRSEKCCDDFISMAIALCKENDIAADYDGKNKRLRKVPAKIRDSVVTESFGLEEGVHTNMKNNIYF